MGNTIQKCKLFLALGEEQELQNGYEKIGAYIQRLNRTCRAEGLQLQLIPYGAKEGSFLSGGAAVDVHKEVQDCEVALFLFYRDVPEALKEELQEVYALFQKTKKPKILTFFRLEEGAAAVGVGDRLEKLLDYIGSDIRHYYNVYSHIDSVTLALVTHMAELGWVHGPRMVNGKILLPGGEVIDSSHLEVFRNNRELQELREQWRRHSVQPGSREEQELLQKISSLESSILQDMMQMFRELVGGSTISARRQAAYRAFAQGDYARALVVLDRKTIQGEIAAIVAAGGAVKGALQERAEELHLRVRSLRAAANDEETEEEIASLYEEIYRLILEWRLDPAPLYEYAKYLYNKNDCVHAREVGDTLRGEYCKPDTGASEEDIAKLLLLLGNINSKIADKKARKQAERDYRDALEILEELAEKDPAHYVSNLATIYNSLGNFYSEDGHRQEAEECYQESLEIRKRLAKAQPAVYEPHLANIYNSLGVFYSDDGRRQEAEKYCQESLKIRLRLAQAQPSVYEPDLATIYNNLGIFYKKDGRRQEAEECYQKSRELYERLAKAQPAVYEPDLATIYNNLGNFYREDGRRQEAEDHYKKSLEICRRLAQAQPAVYEPGLADIYNNLGIFYQKDGRRQEAENCYQESLKIYERLAKEQSSVYEPNLATIYNNLGVFYSDDGRRQEAEKCYQGSLKIRLRLAQARPSVYEPDLAMTYNNLGNFYQKDGRRQEAEECYQRSLEVRKHLAQAQPAVYERDLANIYNNLGAFYSEDGRRQEAEECYQKSLEIRKRLAQAQPAVHEPDLAMGYYNLGMFYYTGDCREEAMKHFAQAYALAQKYRTTNADCALIYERLKNMIED